MPAFCNPGVGLPQLVTFDGNAKTENLNGEASSFKLKWRTLLSYFLRHKVTFDIIQMHI
jgi:hypothetical protein